MLKCSVCTAGFTEDFNPGTNCSECNSVLEHVCPFCRRSSLNCIVSMVCYKCRPHMCLSKCTSGCVLKKNPPIPKCLCKDSGKSLSRFKVNKEGKNKGRWFYSCKDCGFFKFE